MTAPGYGLGAHNCDPLRLRKLYRFVQMFPELRRLHCNRRSPYGQDIGNVWLEDFAIVGSGMKDHNGRAHWRL
jgi:hypothetical protein